MTEVRNRRSRRRDRPGGHKLSRLVLGLAALALAVFGAFVLQHDLRMDRTLSQRGVTTTGKLDGTGCLVCRAVPVTFTTASGQNVTAVVTAIGPQSDTAISLRYDPRHPGTVQPAHGVREEEIIAGVALLVSLLALMRVLHLPRRRSPRRNARIRTRAGSGQDATGHVRVLGS